MEYFQRTRDGIKTKHIRSTVFLSKSPATEQLDVTFTTLFRGTAIEGIVNFFFLFDAFSPLRGFFGLFHADSSRKEPEKTPLFPTFQGKETYHRMKLTIPSFLVF